MAELPRGGQSYTKARLVPAEQGWRYELATISKY
jgi:hypothetical protein